jgi:hypothetical protein
MKGGTMKKLNQGKCSHGKPVSFLTNRITYPTARTHPITPVHSRACPPPEILLSFSSFHPRSDP